MTDERRRIALAEQVVAAAEELVGGYLEETLHVRRPGSALCQWCGFICPCPTALLVDAIRAYRQETT